MIRLTPIFPPRPTDDIVHVPLLEPHQLLFGESLEECASPVSERPP